ncbi:MAG: tetratricopeptide repeat protein [Acidobacteria bacterium]|nr:tetratricopeptide repeat protein [Acidobacteriota bacterium]
MMRAAGAAAVITLYYWVLVAQPQAESSDRLGGELQAAMESSASLFVAKDFAAALEPTEFLVEHMPTQPMYADRLARIYNALGRAEDEARSWDHLMEVSATPEDACPMVGQAHQDAGHAENALTAFEKCVAAEPRDPDFKLFLGRAYTAAGHRTKARREFEEGLTLAPLYPDLHLLLGVLDFGDDRRLDARRRFERFLELAPERRDEVAVWLKRTGSRR